MKAYIAMLQRAYENEQAKKQSRPPLTPIKPLDQQIVELMRSLPPVLRDRPWSISEITEKLDGKFRRRPHAQGVGMALRKLGWIRIRPSGVGGERRLWVPPTS